MQTNTFGLAAEQARLAEYDRAIKLAETDKVRAEANIDQLEKQLEEIDNELLTMGVDPEKAPDELKNHEKEIVELGNEAGRLIAQAEELKDAPAKGAVGA